MKKFLFTTLLLFSGSALADIESVTTWGDKSLLVLGTGLGTVNRATLARKPLRIEWLPGERVSMAEVAPPIGTVPSVEGLLLSCYCPRLPAGTHRLRLFRYGKPFAMDVTVVDQGGSVGGGVPK